MTILFLDHYDSFTNNLTSWFQARNINIKNVPYHDAAFIYDFSQIKAVIFSPGPGHPAEYIDSIQLYKRLPKEIPFLGVCLGHQIFLLAEGGKIEQINSKPIHGRQVEITDSIISRHLDNFTPNGRFVLYNSLGCRTSDPIFSKDVVSLADEIGFSLIAEHKSHSRIGVQFHPESFASPSGDTFLNAFLRFASC